MTKRYTLLAEIGATNARLALMDENAKRIGEDCMTESTSLSVEYIMSSYLKKHRQRKVTQGYIAVAGPVVGDQVVMGNKGATFSISHLQDQLGFPIKVCNDLYAHAASLATLDGKDYVVIAGPEAPPPPAPQIIIGIGTGLGMSVITPALQSHQRPIISPTEAGYTDLPLYRPDFKINGALQRVLKEREPQFAHFVHDHIPVVAEYVLSGKGLLRLYQAVCQLDHMPIQPYEPRHITENTMSNNECLKAIEYFIVFLGRFVRNMMFAHGALGGVFLTGGVIQAIHKSKLFDARLFRESCYGVGRETLDYYMRQIPVAIIKSEDGGLQGLRNLWLTDNGISPIEVKS